MDLRAFLDGEAVGSRHAESDVPTPQDHRSPHPPRCAHCGDVIGVYERLIEVTGGTVARETARAAEPHLASTPATPWYHGPCYEAAAVP